MIRDPTFTKKLSESVDPDLLRLCLDPDPMILDPRKYFEYPDRIFQPILNPTIRRILSDPTDFRILNPMIRRSL